MGKVISGVTDAFGLTDSKAGDRAAKASIAGSQISADAQREALEYLKEVDAVPRGFREAALGRMAGVAGLEGGEGSQQGMIDQAMQSPMYKALLEGGQEQANANASAMGMTRSGNLYAESGAIQNRALVQSYNAQMQGLQGLSGLPSMAPQIAQTTAGIGQTLGQGQIAAAQAQMQSSANTSSSLMGIASLGLMALGPLGFGVIGGAGAAGAGAAGAGAGAGASAAFSDIRLKENIVFSHTDCGYNIYSWDWNEAAGKLGLFGCNVGVMAHEVYETTPEAIGECEGYITVDYAQLNLQEAA